MLTGNLRGDKIDPVRVLYFDIDGVFLAYDDTPKALLTGGKVQQRLDELGFEKLVCVSGWADLVQTEFVGRPPRSREARLRELHELIAAVLPTWEWFLARVELGSDTDRRCTHIDLASDWYYVDDWADKFFIEAHGLAAYERNLHRAGSRAGRILLADPHGGGGDVLDWLDAIPPVGTSSDTP